MTGSIACYKACQTVSRLVQSGHEVQIIATNSALKFIGPATLEGLTGRKVLSDMYEEGQMMSHIHWARWADLILVAPATANFINKIANGLADDLASTLFLAHDFTRPFLVAPAMNSSMYYHPVTQHSLKRLQALGVQVLETASGVLACGEEGYGKLLDPELILGEVSKHLQNPSAPQRKPAEKQADSTHALRILVTAGGTSEPIDDVRVMTNRSTGSTGVQLSQKFWECGFPVTLLLSESSPFTSPFAWAQHEFEVLKFSDYESLKGLLHHELSQKNYSHVFHLAAVSDYSVARLELDGIPVPDSRRAGKIASDQQMSIILKSNPKIVNDLKKVSANKKIKLIAFKLTSGADEKSKLEAVEKLMTNSASDYVVHNDWVQIKQTPENHIFSVYKTNSKVSGQTQSPKDSMSLAVQTTNVAGLAEYFIQEIL